MEIVLHWKYSVELKTVGVHIDPKPARINGNRHALRHGLEAGDHAAELRRGRRGGAVGLGVKNGAILGEDVDLIGGQEVSGVWMR